MVKHTIGDALKQGIALLNKNSIENAGIDTRVIMCTLLGCDKLFLTVHRDDGISQGLEDKFFELIKRRATDEPLGYILNNKEFMSLDFYVDKNVLIPRPDTEILVEKAISHFKGKKPSITDMCTGSGAIAVALARYIPGSKITGLDISSDAVKIARYNAKKNGVSENCSFLVHDILEPFKTLADAVVSNPPYIPSRDVKSLDKTVNAYEPHIALDGGIDGLTFYRAIIENIKFSLKPGGLLALEIGCGLLKDVLKLMENDFYNVGVIKDLSGIERVVYGTRK